MKKHQSRIWLVGLVIAVGLGIFVATSCTRSAKKAENGTSKKLTKITLATSKNIWCTYSLIADEQGFFAKEGLDVDVEYLQAARYSLDAVISGSADFGNIVEVNVSYLGYTGADNISIVGTIVSSSDSSAIVARKSSGISKPADLKGKTLALAPGTTSDVFANRFLAKYGLTADDVELMKVQPMAMQGAFIGKGADAVSIWQPFIHGILTAVPDDAVVLSDPDVYTGYMTIATRKDWVAQNQDPVKAFMRALRSASKFVDENPEEAQKIVSKAIGLDLEVVKSIWGQYTFSLSMDTEQMIKNVTEIGEWIGETQEGYAGKPLPDYTKYFDGSFLNP